MRKTRCAYFSLIETMVVMTIMLLLASLLRPILANVHSKGEDVECISHLKQLAIATVIHAGDNGNRLPHEDAGATTPPHNQAWYQMGVSRFERGLELGINPLKNEPLEYMKGFNIKMNDRLEDYGSPRSDVFRSLSTIRFPAKTPYLFDGIFSLNWPKGIYTKVSNHHQGGTNFLMLDFHVENVFTTPLLWQKEIPLYWNPDVSLDDQVLN